MAKRSEKARLASIPDRSIPGRAMSALIENGVRYEPVIGGVDPDGVYRTTYRAVRLEEAA